MRYSLATVVFCVSALYGNTLIAQSTGRVEGPSSPPREQGRCNNGPNEKWNLVPLPPGAIHTGFPLFPVTAGKLAFPSVCRGCEIDNFHADIDWGDGQSSVGKIDKDRNILGNHAWQKPGQYKITLKNTVVHCVNAGHGYDGNLAPDSQITINVSDPLPILRLTIIPSQVVHGTNPTGTAYLTAIAPAGGTNVLLESSDITIATVPSFVTVPEGRDLVDFTIATLKAGPSITITAKSANMISSQSTNLKVN